MKTEEIKSDLYALIESLDNKQSLELIKEFIVQLTLRKDGELWESLSENQKNQVLESYEKSKHSQHLITDSEVQERLSKWRSK